MCNILLIREKYLVTLAVNRPTCSQLLCAILCNLLHYCPCYGKTRVWGRYNVYFWLSGQRVNTMHLYSKLVSLPVHLYSKLVSLPVAKPKRCAAAYYLTKTAWNETNWIQKRDCHPGRPSLGSANVYCVGSFLGEQSICLVMYEITVINGESSIW